MNGFRSPSTAPASSGSSRRSPLDTLLAILPATLVAAGMVAVAASFLADDTSKVLQLEILGAVALGGALVVARFAHRAPTDVTGVTAVVLAAFGATLAFGGSVSEPAATGMANAVGEAFRLITGIGTVVAMIVLIRLRRGHGLRSIVADTTIVTLGGWILTWVMVVESSMHRGNTPTGIVMARGVAHSLDITLGFLIVLLVSSGARRALAIRLIAVGVATALVVDYSCALIEAGRVDWDPARVESLMALSLCLIAAGFAHRSIGRLARPRTAAPVALPGYPDPADDRLPACAGIAADVDRSGRPDRPDGPDDLADRVDPCHHVACGRGDPLEQRRPPAAAPPRPAGSAHRVAESDTARTGGSPKPSTRRRSTMLVRRCSSSGSIASRT